MTQAEATAGTETATRVISPKVLSDTISSKIINGLPYEDITLLASSWVGNTYTINSQYVTSDSIQIVFLPDSTLASSDEMDALGGAKLIDGGQSAGTFTLVALGDVPTIDVDIRVLYNYSTSSVANSVQTAASYANSIQSLANAYQGMKYKVVTVSSVTADATNEIYPYKYEVAWPGATNID
jgi:hypothetical protein